MPAVDEALVTRACARHLGHDVTVTGLRRLSGGASRETWSFDVVDASGGTEALVLRRDPGATIGSTDRSTEYELLRAAGAAGVAVPPVRFLLEPDDGLGAGFVMARIEGETIPRKLLRDDEYVVARQAMTAQCARAAAAIHAVPLASLPLLAHQDARTLLEQFRDLVDVLGEPHPTFELALRWLEDHVDALPPVEPALVHGDLRNGNFIVGPEGLRSVLDWELAHVGDPVEDLGWFCVKSWRFGNVAARAGGFGSAEELLAEYAAASGHTVDPDHLFFWEVFGTLKWGVICEMQTFSHLNGLVRSVELAAIGRRVAENEWDLLDLLDPDGHGAVGEEVPSAVATVDTMHDRPTVTELVEAVREYLERDVMAVEGRVGFHARVAARVLAMVERELTMGPALHAAARDRLETMIGTDGTYRELEAELARRIRTGELTAGDDQVLGVVRASVRAKLLVANPAYLDA
ncbi:MAG: phosphotransferase family protein [Acidimicrobiia bacterium]